MLALAVVALLAACNGQQKAPADNKPEEAMVADSTTVSTSFADLVRAEARAALDSTFAATEEYAATRRQYEAVEEKMLESMDETEWAIYQLETAKRALDINGRHFASHTDEMRDPLNQKLMATYSRKLREAQMRIVTLKLTDTQRARVDSINGK